MAKKGYREESDSIGIVFVPRNALYGAQTQRAIDNFPISGIKMDFPFTKSFVSSLGLIKDAAAKANNKLKLLSNKRQEQYPRLLKRYGRKNITKSFLSMYFKQDLEPVQI